jgi:hypothetical protein
LEAVFSVIRAATVAKQRRVKHASATTVELQLQKSCVFVRGPCRGVIDGTSLELSSVKGCVPDGKDVSGL